MNERSPYRLRASTLMETLVMMLVAGIVFLSAMDGLTLLSRYCLRRMEALQHASAQTTGFTALETLLDGADSVHPTAGMLELHKQGHVSTLYLEDSLLLCYRTTGTDTLLRSVGTLALRPGGRAIGAADTMELYLEGMRLTLPLRRPPQTVYRQLRDSLEKPYRYEDE